MFDCVGFMDGFYEFGFWIVVINYVVIGLDIEFLVFYDGGLQCDIYIYIIVCIEVFNVVVIDVVFFGFQFVDDFYCVYFGSSGYGVCGYVCEKCIQCVLVFVQFFDYV